MPYPLPNTGYGIKIGIVMNESMQRFTLDGEESFTGINTGSWNGFACPNFPESELPKIVAHLNVMDRADIWRIDNGWIVCNEDRAGFGELPRYEIVDGYCAVGAYEWVWELVE